MANPSLPSFVELMASLGLQDEHTANALIRGATAVAVADPATPYRQQSSTVSLDSSGTTPLSSASLVTPLSSPSVQRERPTSHGKKRYSPYGLSAADVSVQTTIHPPMFSHPPFFTHIHRSTPDVVPFQTYSHKVTMVKTEDYIIFLLQNHFTIIVAIVVELQMKMATRKWRTLHLSQIVLITPINPLPPFIVQDNLIFSYQEVVCVPQQCHAQSLIPICVPQA